MLDDLEDTHLCIKCSSTVVGLENYINHRKSNCSEKPTSNQIVPEEEHTYGTYDDYGETNNYVSESVPDNKNHHKDESNTITDSYGYKYGLGADIFFSSLELQSSSKKVLQQNPDKIAATASTSGNTKVLTRKATAAILANHEHEDAWINTQTESDELIRAVDNISGHKKEDSIFGLMDFNQESGESSEEEEDEEDDYHIPPQSHTGGKWKPIGSPSLLRSSPHWDVRHQWDFEHSNDFLPPPNYTKGKWVPGTKITKLEYKAEPIAERFFASEQFWCSICNRKLATRLVYERHLKSNLHLKRSQPEKELEEASRPITDELSKRYVKPSIYLNEEIYTNDVERPRRTNKSVSSTITSGALEEELDELDPKKRKRRFIYTKCEVCKTRLPTNLLGKHLISHFHYRRMLKQPEKSFDLILNNMDKIVLQSPFQCQPCRFYANTEDYFIRHWNSVEHKMTCGTENKFWCSFCKFESKEYNQMSLHLLEYEHQEVVLAINRSVPIVIRRRTIITCNLCNQEFRYNIELRKHSLDCTSQPEGTASNVYQSKYICSICSRVFTSRVALQKHDLKFHLKANYFCSMCDLKFSSSEAAKKHRSTSEHKIASAKKRGFGNLKRTCPICSLIVDDVIALKQHINEEHPNQKYSCPHCGDCSFTLPQEVARHVRDKRCQLPTTNIIVEEHQQVSTENNYATYQREEDRTINNKDCIEISYIDHQANPVDANFCPSVTDISPSRQSIELMENYSCELPTTSSLSSVINIASSDLLFSIPASASDENSVYNDEAIKAVQNVGSSKIWECKMCSFRTTLQAECIFHETLHNFKNLPKTTKIPCPICNKSFRKASLRCHLHHHTNERIYQCPLCPTSFTRKHNVKAHIDKVHGTKEKEKNVGENVDKKFICSICGKPFKMRTILELHMHVHRDQTSVIRYPCKIEKCIFSGRSPSELKKHENTVHTNEKIFECKESDCDYKGKSLENLNRHSKKHSTGKNFACTECDFKTKLSAHLKRHKLIHSGMKPFKCPYCEYSCNNSENLRKHVLVTSKHRGRFLYECKYCENSESKFCSNYANEYKAHLREQHDVKNIGDNGD